MGYPTYEHHNPENLGFSKTSVHSLFTKKNLEILDFISENELHLRDIADETKISAAKVHNAVQLFKKYQLVEEIKKKNRKIIILNRESSLFRKMREMIERARKYE